MVSTDHEFVFGASSSDYILDSPLPCLFLLETVLSISQVYAEFVHFPGYGTMIVYGTTFP
jgi:hypothetical protein